MKHPIHNFSALSILLYWVLLVCLFAWQLTYKEHDSALVVVAASMELTSSLAALGCLVLSFAVSFGSLVRTYLATLGISVMVQLLAYSFYVGGFGSAAMKATWSGSQDLIFASIGCGAIVLGYYLSGIAHPK